MLNSTFPYNPLLKSMVYNNEVLTLHFKKQSRRYECVPVTTVYGLFYSKQPAIFFTENIKNKFKVEVV